MHEFSSQWLCPHPNRRHEVSNYFKSIFPTKRKKIQIRLGTRVFYLTGRTLPDNDYTCNIGIPIPIGQRRCRLIRAGSDCWIAKDLFGIPRKKQRAPEPHLMLRQSVSASHGKLYLFCFSRQHCPHGGQPGAAAGFVCWCGIGAAAGKAQIVLAHLGDEARRCGRQ